jgi:hypothetical protein
VAISSITRTVLALRTKADVSERKTYSMRTTPDGRHEVVAHAGGTDTVVFASASRQIAQRHLDRRIDGEA